MITSDQRLLTAFHEVSDGLIHQHLRTLRDGALLRVKTAATDRMANLATGELKVLDDLIEDIETAKDRLMDLHEESQKPRVDMSQSF